MADLKLNAEEKSVVLTALELYLSSVKRAVNSNKVDAVKKAYAAQADNIISVTMRVRAM